jgi:methionine-S-sulfoxide reductase
MGFAIGLADWSPLQAAEKRSPSKSTKTRKAAPMNKPADESTEKSDDKPTGDSEKKKTDTAVFAGGCFWCAEFAFEQLKGVIDVESGYCGGTAATANYGDVHEGFTGHAEVIRVTYDPSKITYEQLLDAFFDSHDPTQLNRQGADVGKQYRSSIFYSNNEQKKQAEAKIADLTAKKVYKKRIVTKLEQLKTFYPAEGYHQDYARRNPYEPYIQGHAVPKAMELREKRPDLLRGKKD